MTDHAFLVQAADDYCREVEMLVAVHTTVDSPAARMKMGRILAKAVPLAAACDSFHREAALRDRLERVDTPHSPLLAFHDLLDLAGDSVRAAAGLLARFLDKESRDIAVDYKASCSGES